MRMRTRRRSRPDRSRTPASKCTARPGWRAAPCAGRCSSGGACSGRRASPPWYSASARRAIRRCLRRGAMDNPAFSQLTWFERLAFRVMRFLNVSRIGRLWQRVMVTPFVGLVTSRRLRVHGLERLDGVPPDAPILLVANHRTFFDLFILGRILVTHPRLSRRLSFPVRSNFFYENPLGLLIAVVMTGGSMFPPFFRSADKKGMNRHSLDILIEKLRTPGEMVGFHPEGTRNKTSDPYSMLPAQPGAGELAIKARPIVIPA